MSNGFDAVDAELTLTLEGQAVGSIANNLTTDVEGYALDARQGKVLDQKKLDVSKVANNRTTVEEGWALDARQGKWLDENKVGFSDVADNLTTDDKNKVLDARQGKVLDQKKLDVSKVANNRTTVEEGWALDARQGKWLDENKVGFSDVADNLTTDDKNKVLSAAQGKAMKSLLDQYKAQLDQKKVLDAYPVGSIYLSANSTSPASLFGGTWTQLKDRFLLGAGGSYGNGTTGGTTTVALTVAQMPSHTHTFSLPVCVDSNPGGGVAYQLAGYETATETFDNINASGGGQAHNNMPPYLAVYMWKRVA